MASQEQEIQLQNPMFVLDALYCEEEHFEEDFRGYDFQEENEKCHENVEKTSLLFDHDLFWDEDELVSLMSKEKGIKLVSDGSRVMSRRRAVEWMLRVNAHFGFTSITAVLAVNYFDRFISSHYFQRDKPWMSQLAAVACLSLAAKVEETRVPLLLDLQVESKYVFEAKTIQRMELLVLSALQWKMNPVTPLSFFNHIIRRLGLNTPLHLEFRWRCERLLLSVVTDSRFVSHLPSELATATMLHVIKDVKPCTALDYQNQLLGVLKISEDKLDDCCKLFWELSGNLGYKEHQTHKRKYVNIPGSPNDVIDAYFSCDSSNESWAVASSLSSSPEPLFKKSKAQDQQMRLASLNRMSVGMLGGTS